jgi:4-amino-4-deoxy-L-arabinose transferase-like glycosyltransferase
MSENSSAPVPVSGLTWQSQLLKWLARRPAATLGMLFVLLWSPALLSLPPLDRDESRFAESSSQMLASGNFLDIRFGHVPRYKKPIGIYWLQASATAVAGMGSRSHIWTYRLPSLAGGLAAVLLTFWCARIFASAEEAWLAAALLGGTLLLTAESVIATTDAVQLACVVGVMSVLMSAYAAARDPQRTGPSTGLVLAGWGALAAGILVKGPVVPAVALATILALVVWDRDGRWLLLLKPQWGVPLAIALVAPWVIAISLASHGEFFHESLGQDFAAKLAGGQETHGAWPGYYLALVTLSFWPAVLFLAPGLGAAIRRRADPAIRFLLAWAGACWLMFELVPTKLPHYVLPAYPALAIIAATWAVGSHEAHPPRWQTALIFLAISQFVVGLIVLVVAPPEFARLYGSGPTWWLIGAGLVGGLLGLAAAASQFRAKPILAAGLAMSSALIMYPAMSIGGAASMDQLWISPRVAALVAKNTQTGDPPPALAGYTEPSLVFFLGKDVLLTNGPGAADAGAGQGGLALVEDGERLAFLTHLRELEADAHEVGDLSGFNYSRGKRVHITLYRVNATHDITEPPAE